MRKYYPGITIFKLFGSLTVLLSHTKLPGIYQKLAQHVPGLQQMMAIMVPCFYIIAGFLAYEGWSHARSARQYITRYLTWVVGVYALFCAFYIITSALPGYIVSYRAHTFSLGQIKMLFEIFFVTGPSTALWFIPPLIFGILATYYFERKGLLTVALVLAGLGYVFAQLMTGTLRVATETSLGDLPLYHVKHAKLLAQMAFSYLGVGFPFVLAGALVAKHEGWFMQISKKSFLLFTALTIVAEALFLGTCTTATSSYPLVFTTIPGGLLLFYGVLHIQASGVQAHHALINRYSAVVYFSHIPLIILNLKILGWQWSAISTPHALVCVVMTLTETIALTMLITLYPNRNKLAPA